MNYFYSTVLRKWWDGRCISWWFERTDCFIFEFILFVYFYFKSYSSKIRHVITCNCIYILHENINIYHCRNVKTDELVFSKNDKDCNLENMFLLTPTWKNEFWRKFSIHGHDWTFLHNCTLHHIVFTCFSFASLLLSHPIQYYLRWDCKTWYAYPCAMFIYNYISSRTLFLVSTGCL